MEDSPSFFLPTARHRYTRAQKIAMVEESMRPGVSIASVARAHGINANQPLALESVELGDADPGLESSIKPVQH